MRHHRILLVTTYLFVTKLGQNISFQFTKQFFVTIFLSTWTKVTSNFVQCGFHFVHFYMFNVFFVNESVIKCDRTALHINHRLLETQKDDSWQKFPK